MNYYVDEFSPNGTVVGTPLIDDQTYWHRVLAGEISADPGQERVYSYSIISGNTDSAFAMDEDTSQITVANSGILDYNVNPIFSLTARAEDDEGTQVLDDITITVNLNDL